MFWRGIIYALVGALLWGLSGACIQFLEHGYEIASTFITIVRSLVALVLFLVFMLLRRRERLIELASSKKSRWKLLLFGTGIFLSQSTYAMSIMYTNAGTATVLQALNTVFVMLYVCARSKSLPRIVDFLGLLCAIVSVFLIATQGDFGVIVLPVAGIFWGLANAIAATIYVVVPRGLYKRFDSMTVIGCGMVIASAWATIAWIVTSASQGALQIPSLDGFGWLVLIVGVGFLGTFAAFGLYLNGVSIVGSIKGSLLGTGEPVGAMVMAAIWLGTPFTAYDWIGFLLMVAMIFLVSIRSKRTS